MYVQSPEYVRGARGSLWNLPRCDRMDRAGTFPLVPAFNYCFMSACSVSRFLARLWNDIGDSNVAPALENLVSFALLEVEVQIVSQTPMRCFATSVPSLASSFQALLALMGLSLPLQVFRLRANGNELAASLWTTSDSGTPLSAYSSPEEPSPSLSLPLVSLAPVWLPSLMETRTIDIGNNSNLCS